jgi:hypothetical protein
LPRRGRVEEVGGAPTGGVVVAGTEVSPGFYVGFFVGGGEHVSLS